MSNDVFAVDGDPVALRDRADQQRRAPVLRVGMPDRLPRVVLVLDADGPRVRGARVERGVALGDELRDAAAPRADEVVRAHVRARVLKPVERREVRPVGLVDDDRGDRHRPPGVVVAPRRRDPVDRRVVVRRRGKRRRRRQKREAEDQGDNGDPTHLQERATYLAPSGRDKVPSTHVLFALLEVAATRTNLVPDPS